MKKFAIHIHLYLTSQSAEDLAYENLKRLKNAGFSIITTSPKKLPEKFYECIDYLFFDRENQLLQDDYEDTNPLIWWRADDKVNLSFIISYLQTHSLAVLRSMIRGCEIAKILDFDYIIRFEYDDIFGDHSMLKIKEKLNYIESNNLDFYLYRDSDSENAHISVHLMFYKAQSFLSIFEAIKNEFDYNKFLKRIGLEKKAIVLEQFLHKLINKNNFLVEYADVSKMNEEFIDSRFNLEQTAEVGTRDGLLSDVMRIKDSSGYIFSSVALATQNVNCNENAIVYFDFYDNQENLVDTISLSTSFNKEFMYEIVDINRIKNVKKIKIRHKEKSHHKTFYVKIIEDKIEIEYPKVYGGIVPEFLMYK